MKQITREMISSFLPKRPSQSHKGSFGRVLVVAGSRTMCGAGFLCAKSALLAGAGLVFWALPKSMQPAFAAALPEAITFPLSEDEQGNIAAEAAADLAAFCAERHPSVAVIGPGLGESRLIPAFLQETNLPLVVDADALNALSRTNWPETWPQNKPAVFTPHPGEMARLLGLPPAENELHRMEQVERLARLTGGVALLKGKGTLVCTVENDQPATWQNTTGGPALAKAGSGDVLSGVIAGLWAQLGAAEGFHNKSALKAALCGVYLHGLAGDLAAAKRSDFGVLACDTAVFLPQAFLEVLN